MLTMNHFIRFATVLGQVASPSKVPTSATGEGPAQATFRDFEASLDASPATKSCKRTRDNVDLPLLACFSSCLHHNLMCRLH